jgi:hypothetical protein
MDNTEIRRPWYLQKKKNRKAEQDGLVVMLYTCIQ